MTKRMITEVDGQSSKVEELETLSRIAAACKPGSYLHSFLSPAVVSKLHWSIQNDWSCDLYGDLVDHGNSLIAELQMAKKRIAYLEQKVDEHQHTYNRLNDIIEGQQNTLNAVRGLVSR